MTVLRTRQRYVEGGLDFALNELPRAGRLPKIDDKIETILTTLAQSHPPNGRVRWTLQLLAVVLDNLNTHSPAAFYEAFSPQQARYLTKKLEFHYTPEHSSWLNMAEVEISVLTEQCLDRRLASQAIVASEVGAWESERNAVRATIDWRFTIPNARDKLKKLYPVGEE